MRYERVKITRDPHTVYNRDVLPWEVAVLEFTFGDGNVIRQDAVIDTETLYPEAGVEFQRLTQAYGSDPTSGVPYVASVYGQASAGVNHLRRAIAEAKQEYEDSKPKPSSKRKAATRRVPRADVMSDPLMA